MSRSGVRISSPALTPSDKGKLRAWFLALVAAGSARRSDQDFCTQRSAGLLIENDPGQEFGSGGVPTFAVALNPPFDAR
jgi:hypothetical protein